MAMNASNGAPLELGALASVTIRDPRRAAATLADARFGRGVGLLMALVAAIILAAAERMAVVITGFDPVVAIFDQMREDLGPEAADLQAPSPFDIVMVELLIMMALFAFISAVASIGGAAFGGRGRPETIVVLTGWWLLVFATIRSALALLAAVAPAVAQPLLGIAMLLTFGYLLYLYGAFIAEAHGFKSPGMTLLAGVAMSAAALFGIAIVSSLLLSLFVSAV